MRPMHRWMNSLRQSQDRTYAGTPDTLRPSPHKRGPIVFDATQNTNSCEYLNVREVPELTRTTSKFDYAIIDCDNTRKQYVTKTIGSQHGGQQSNEFGLTAIEIDTSNDAHMIVVKPAQLCVGKRSSTTLG